MNNIELIILTQPTLPNCKLSELLPMLKIVAKQSGLKLSRLSDFKKAQRKLLIQIAHN